MLSVESAHYAGDYAIELVFNNGQQGVADLKATIFNDPRPIFSQLKDQACFKSFKVAHSAIAWPNDLDLACEYLFYLAFKDRPELQAQFKQWGYLDSI